MAKQKTVEKKPEHGAKAKAVRDYIAANPSAKAKDVVAALKEQGVEVAVGNVYQVMNAGNEKRSAKSHDPSLEELQEFMPVVAEAGGFDKAMRILLDSRKLIQAAKGDYDLAVKLCHLAEKVQTLFGGKKPETESTEEAA
jgi:hypothetical protein